MARTAFKGEAPCLSPGAQQPPSMQHTSRARSLPVTRWTPHSDMDVGELVYRDTRYPQVRRSRSVDEIPFVEESVGLNTVVHFVGQVQELVDLIFSFAQRPLLHSCLFVCKAYSCIAKKYLWREPPSTILLFNLLGPITTVEQPGSYFDCWTFSPSPSEAQWERFYAYAKYVKNIAQSSSWSLGTTDLFDPELTQWSDHEDSDSEDLELVEDESRSALYSKSPICTISDEALAVLETPKPKSLRLSSIGQLSLIPNLEQLNFTFGNSYTPPTAFLPFLRPGLVSLDLRYHVCARVFEYSDETAMLMLHISESLRALATCPPNRSPLPSLRRLKIRLDDGDLSLLRGYEDINRAILEVLDKSTELEE
ncbi:hypothetical protein FRC01_009203, partial [Tulasnella sp. 417]